MTLTALQPITSSTISAVVYDLLGQDERNTPHFFRVGSIPLKSPFSLGEVEDADRAAVRTVLNSYEEVWAVRI